MKKLDACVDLQWIWYFLHVNRFGRNFCIVFKKKFQSEHVRIKAFYRLCSNLAVQIDVQCRWNWIAQYSKLCRNCIKKSKKLNIQPQLSKTLTQQLTKLQNTREPPKFTSKIRTINWQSQNNAHNNILPQKQSTKNKISQRGKQPEKAHRINIKAYRIKNQRI